ncbi:MAG TPA: TylF/MycF/NovP-related O-methyltransferase [Fibrobacteria bacterium]|nr:TylF/MycF/NovP-related O-methyltransferase [Fibrobacteria bacterium]
MKKRPIREFFRRFWILRRLYAWWQVAIAVPPTDYFRFKKTGRIREVYPYSMSGYKRLANVYDLAVQVHEKNIPGAFVECGVWKGGCIGLMATVARDYASNRKIILFDSFEGLPEPTAEDGVEAVEYSGGRTTGALKAIDQCVAPLDVVKELFFDRLHIDEKNVEFRKGWFQDTVPGSGPSVGPIAIIRLDGDWYDSIMVCLEGLYDQVVSGGYIVIDDYQFWEGCRKAVDDFIAKRNLKVRLIPIDFASSYFRKP